MNRLGSPVSEPNGAIIEDLTTRRPISDISDSRLCAIRGLQINLLLLLRISPQDVSAEALKINSARERERERERERSRSTEW
jgi:hypothetical protein